MTDDGEIRSVCGTYYKYRPIGESGSDQRDRILKTLRDGEIYFARPDQFNDLYDCNPVVRMDHSDDIYLERLADLYQRRMARSFRAGPNISALDARQRFRRLSNPDDRTDLLYEVINRAFCVYSMSKEPNSPSQWDRYADSYTGCCLELLVPESVTDVFEVTYRDSRPEADLLELLSDDNTQGLQYLLLQKTTEWQSEQEVRALALGAGSVKPIRPMQLEAIIFGPSTPSEYEEVVRGAVSDQEMTFKRAIRSSSGSKLEVVPA